jgi:hypothetical protein
MPYLLQSDVSAFAKSLVDETYNKAVLPRIPKLISREIIK